MPAPRERMAHGYTNRTAGGGGIVVKEYAGPDAAARHARERSVLGALRGGPVPVPALAAGAGDDGAALVTRLAAGVHAQELLDGADAPRVLAACGRVLARIHAVDVAAVLGAGASGVLVHGDFGPNNLLLDPVDYAVTAVVDWEFAHAGEPVEDLAWCEWIVRAHHPGQVGALRSCWAAYEAGGGRVPGWPVRRAAMAARARELRAWSQRWPDGAAERVRVWDARVAAIGEWAE